MFDVHLINESYAPANVYGLFQVLFAILRTSTLRTVTNLLICNLSIADILFSLGIPFIAVTRVTQNWILGDFVCKAVTYIQFVSAVCSILTMVTISVDRFTRICLMNRFKMASRDLVIVLVAIWIISTSFPVPVAISQTVQTAETRAEIFHFCGVTWLEGFNPEIFFAFMISFFFFIPLIVMSIFYVRIWLTVRASTERISSANGANKSEMRYAEKQIRLVKMFSCIVILFVLMWLPFFIISFLGVHYKQITSTHFTATLILALANTCQNPVLYGYFNYKLRDQFKIIYFEKLCRRRRRCTTYIVQEPAGDGSRSQNNSSTV